ncbi:MAG: ATP-binding protein [Candidatus Sericytochromatia bacterium]
MSSIDEAISPADPLDHWRVVLAFLGRHDALGYLRGLCPSPRPAQALARAIQHERDGLLRQLQGLDLAPADREKLAGDLAAFLDQVLVEAFRWCRQAHGEPVIWPWPQAPSLPTPPTAEPLLSVLEDTTRQILMELDLRQLLSLLVGRAVRLTQARAALLAMGPLEAGAFEIVESHGLPAGLPQRLVFGEQLPERLLNEPGAFLANVDELPWLSEAFGERSGLLVAPLRHHGELVGLLACLQGEGAQAVEVLSLLANHTTIAIRNAALYRDALQKASALHAANEQLRDLDRMKDQFLATVSHELRTPINFITGFGTILLEEDDGNLSEEQRHFIDRMLGGAFQLLSLVTDLLDYSSIRAGRLSLHRQPVALGPLIEETIDSLSVLASARESTIALMPEAELGDWCLDRRRFRQILTNMLANAIKFSPPGSRIALYVGTGPEGLRVEVVDAGLGVPENKRQAIFDRFSQLDGSATRGAGGVGLGLAIAKSLAVAHGGAMGVESPPPPERAVEVGQGSMFWVMIPAGDS